MSKTHMTMKELKHDAFQDAGRSAFDYIRDHANRIGLVIGGVILVVFVIWLATATFGSRGQEAAQLMMDARMTYGQAVSVSDATERGRLLETVIQQCADVRTQHPSSVAASRSYLLEGQCETLRGEHQQALAVYQQFLAQAKSAEDKAQGNLLVGQAYENQYFANPKEKDLLQSALKAYEVASQPGADGKRTYVNWEAMLALARVHRMAGDLEKAVALYKEIASGRVYYDNVSEEEEDKGDLEGREAERVKIRESVRDVLSMASFQKTAENQLKVVEAQLSKAAR